MSLVLYIAGFALALFGEHEQSASLIILGCLLASTGYVVKGHSRDLDKPDADLKRVNELLEKENEHLKTILTTIERRNQSKNDGRKKVILCHNPCKRKV